MRPFISFLALLNLFMASCALSPTSPSVTPTDVTIATLPTPTPLPSSTPQPSATIAATTTVPMDTLTPTVPASPTTESESDWAVYHNPDYGFSFLYPSERWAVIERDQDRNQLSLVYHDMGIALRMRFKRITEYADLLLYGGAAGDFVPQGTIDFLGQAVERTAVVYQDIVRAVHYNQTNEIERGSLHFTLALISNRDYERGAIVPDDVQAEADRILETFNLDDAGDAPQSTTADLPILFYHSGDLSRTDVAGSAVQPLAPASAGGEPGAYFFANPPQVSPDGRWLLDHVSADQTTGSWRLFDVATGERIAAGSGQARLSPTWSPDSAAFAFLDESGVCIYTIESAAEACTPIADSNGTLSDLIAAAWSPDGATIALAQMDMSAECCRVTVWLYALDGGDPYDVAIIDPPAQGSTAEMMEWLPDGRLLLKSTSADAPSLLYDPADGSRIIYEGWVRAASPDGRWLLHDSGAVSGLDGATLFTLTANDACPRPLLTGANWAWSPDGMELAFLLNCAAAAEDSWLYVVDAATGEIRWQKTLPTPAEALYPLERVFWSPDGAYLLLDGVDTTAESTRPLSPIWRLETDGTGELDVLVTSGYLVDVVAPWAEH